MIELTEEDLNNLEYEKCSFCLRYGNKRYEEECDACNEQEMFKLDRHLLKEINRVLGEKYGS